MTGCPAHARTDAILPPRKPPKDEPPPDVEDDEEAGEEDDEDSEDALDESRDDGDPDPEEDGETEADSSLRDFMRSRQRGRSRGASGMGRPSTGPAPRPAPTPLGDVVTDVVTELAPDIATWPGTAEAARQVGRHPSTIKLWRTQGRIRATQDGSGCWRHHPDDLAEAVDTPDATDPGSVLASGMSAIVQQGASANERLLRMTELTTDGLKDAAKVLSDELKRAYARIEELEKKLSDLRDKHAATHADDLRHERFIRRLDLKHELDIAGAKETSARLNGLLITLGPIAASIGARLLGRDQEAAELERSAVTGKPAPPQNSGDAPQPPASATAATSSIIAPPFPVSSALTDSMPIETRIADAMGRLCVAIRLLDQPQFAGLRAMLPPQVAAALDDIAQNQNDSVVGRALAVIVKAAQNLSDLQFMALRPIAPADVAAVLAELRQLIRQNGVSTTDDT